MKQSSLQGRRQTREWIIQFLFQQDFNPEPIPQALSYFWEDKSPVERERLFAEHMIRGVIEHQRALDETLSNYARNWSSDRLAAVDRTVMRLALYEMLHCDETPPVVAINEAVHFAKDLSSLQSGRFVNGVLDRIRKELDRPARTPNRPVEE
jgi:N utilization substance protein B